VSEYMDIEEFREKGYLQEVNRRFLHPIGLALAVTVDDAGVYSLSGVLDARDDPEGFVFDYSKHPDPSDALELNQVRANYIDAQEDHFGPTRERRFGWRVQPAGTSAK
jgi:hypothetical protein